MKPGMLSITKTTSNHEDDYVSLVIQDGETHKRVIVMKASMREWAEACFALGARPVEYQTYPIQAEPRQEPEQ